MKIRVIVDRQDGPIIGSQLCCEYVVPDMELAEIRPRDDGGRETDRVLAARRRFINMLSGNVARALQREIEEALDKEHPAG